MNVKPIFHPCLLSGQKKISLKITVLPLTFGKLYTHYLTRTRISWTMYIHNYVIQANIIIAILLSST